MRIHFVGSEGVSMKALAAIMSSYGHIVSGSDIVSGGHCKDNVVGKELVVYTTAVGEDNEEVVFARELGVPTIERAKFLGEVAKNYKTVIAVSGSHGKTTTTGFVEQIFLPLCPTVHIGGRALDENAHIGGTEYFISEACEYKRSFLHIKPAIAIVLNMELDHTDYYKDENDYIDAFISFASGAKKTLVFSGDPSFDRLAHKDNVVSFGYKDTDYYAAKNITSNKLGYSFDIYKAGKRLVRAATFIAGRHNVINALAAASAAFECGLSTQLVVEGLAKFAGVKRRFEHIKMDKNFSVYSDYAHHPSEIKTTIQTARSLCKKRVTIVFEPHTYSRTKSLLAGFADSLSSADRVVIVPIYAAREDPIEGVTAIDIVLSLTKMGVKAVYFDTFYAACRYINSTTKSGEIVVFTGAGEIEKAPSVLARL